MLCEGNSDWSRAAGGVASLLCCSLRVELSQSHTNRGKTQTTYQHPHDRVGRTKESWPCWVRMRLYIGKGCQISAGKSEDLSVGSRRVNWVVMCQ